MRAARELRVIMAMSQHRSPQSKSNAESNALIHAERMNKGQQRSSQETDTEYRHRRTRRETRMEYAHV